MNRHKRRTGQRGSQLCTYLRRRLQFQSPKQSELILSRIATDYCVLQEYKRLPLLRRMTEASQEMMFNELEIVVWGLYLDKFLWKGPVEHLEYMLYVTAYAVKTYLNDLEEALIFQEYLGDKLPGFNRVYNNWVHNARCALGILPHELNEKFRKLHRPVLTQGDWKVNYNYYVDEILESAPLYQAEKKAKLDESGLSRQVSHIDSAAAEGTGEENAEKEPSLALNMFRTEGTARDPPFLSRMNSAFKLEELGSFMYKSSVLEPSHSEKEEEPPALSMEKSLFSQHFNTTNTQ